MFKNAKAFSSYSIISVDHAKDFYVNSLGLEIREDMEGMMTLKLHGGGEVNLYSKGDEHQAASFTVLNFVVDDLEKCVADLKEKGVKFESYDNENMKTDEDNISRDNGMKIAWFTDPCGNILGVMQLPE